MKDYKIRLHGRILYVSNAMSEKEALRQYKFFCGLASKEESGFTGIGVQLFHNDLCIRELASNASEDQTGT